MKSCGVYVSSSGTGSSSRRSAGESITGGVVVHEDTDRASDVADVGDPRSETVIGLDSASLVSPFECFLMFSSLCSLRKVRMAARRMIVLDFESRRRSGSLRMKCQV